MYKRRVDTPALLVQSCSFGFFSSLHRQDIRCAAATMKGPNSRRPLSATRSPFVILIIVLLTSAPSLVSTRSVENSRHHHHRHEIRQSNPGIYDDESNLKETSIASKNVRKNENVEQSHFPGLGQVIAALGNTEEPTITREENLSGEKVNVRGGKGEIKDGDGTLINPALPSAQLDDASSSDNQEGIRRFDAIVVNDETAGKISSVREKEISKDRPVENSELLKTVVRGITVRDGPVNADGLENDKIHDVRASSKAHRKRSLKEPPSVHADVSTPGNKNHTREQTESSTDYALEKNVHPVEPQRVPVLIPVAANHTEAPVLLSSEDVGQPLITVDKKVREKNFKHANDQSDHGDESSGTETGGSGTVKKGGIISDSNEAHEKLIDATIESYGDRAAGDFFAPETEEMISPEGGPGELEKKSEGPISNARTVSVTDKDDNHEEKHAGAKRIEHDSKPQVQVIHQTTLNSTSLSGLLRTNVSLEELKTQAISLQGSLKNKTFLQRLRNDTVEILPKIPKFTEKQLFDALNVVSVSKKVENHTEYSYLSKMDTSILSENQLKIVRCAEALVVREERKTFAENMMECIRGLSVLNCMRIFVWPVIVENLPESFTQNLPTLPIEVNVADWWSGNQREKLKNSRIQSTASSHAYKFVTPEIVVSNILKDALSGNPNIRTDLPTFIDPKNETLSKLLTNGQLEILRMAEMFLPESSRQEYSERMYSCVRRFEYFSCVKYFTWPMVKQHYPALPDFPDYQSWYPNVSVYPGYPILPYPSVEGIGELPEVVEADATRTSSPKPEDVIVEILENTLRKTSPATPTLSTAYHLSGQRGVPIASITADQMAIFYTAEQLIPEAMRPEFMSKTINCIRNYDYLTCTKYSTWPTVRQLYPELPQFPDFSSWIPTFSLPELPDFSEYIISLVGSFPSIPGFPEVGPSGHHPQTTPQPETQPQQPDSPQPQPQQPIVIRPPYQPHPQQPQPLPPLQPPAQQPQPLPQHPPPVPPLQSQPQHPLLPVIRPQPQQPITIKPPYLPQSQPQAQPEPQLQPESQSPPQPEPNPDRPSYLPHAQPQPIPDKPPYQTKEDQRLPGSMDLIESRIIQILSNIRLIVLARNSQQDTPVTRGTLDVLSGLTYNQLKIFGLSKSVIPAQLRRDLDSRFVGCLQGGSDFLSCTKNVIWPTLRLYVKDMPNFPDKDETKASQMGSSVGLYSADPKIVGFPERYVITPAIYQPIAQSSMNIAGRSPLKEKIVAESDHQLPSVNSPGESPFTVPSDVSDSHLPVVQLRQDITEKSSGSLNPVISITDTRFTPIFTDYPETVLLAILTAIRSYSKLPDNSQANGSPGRHFEHLKNYLSPDQLRVLQISENLLPINTRANFVDKISRCAENSNFMDCTRDIVWPTLAQYYPKLPSFPNFYIEEDSTDKLETVTSGFGKKIGPNAEVVSSAISETDVKTGQHGDAMVTITDTRFVPIFSEHPEGVILGILRNVQTSMSKSSGQQATVSGTFDKSSEFSATITDAQGNIITVAGSLLPESIREEFNKRMAECMKENAFLVCTRDIAWPTIAQFFPRLPNFPNIGAISEVTVNDKPAQQPAVLTPHLPPTGISETIVPTKPTLALAMENFVPAIPEDEVESRIESTLKDISPTTENSLQSKQTHQSTKDPLVSPLVTERQASVIRMCEDLLPNSVKPIFVGKMVECSRSDVFPNCIRNVGWPTLRQYVPQIPELPDFGNIGSYFPQVAQEIPAIPQFPNYQLPSQVTNIPGFAPPGQGFLYPFRAAQDRVSHPEAVYVPQGSIVAGGQPNGFYLSAIQGLAPSVDSSASVSSRARTGSPGYSSVVSTGHPIPQSSDISINDQGEEVIIKSPGLTEGRRKRRSLDTERLNTYQDISSNHIDSLPLNLTESEFLGILINITRQKSNESGKIPDDPFVEKLNTTMKDALTADQYRILKIIENISSQTDRAGFMSKVVQCIRSLSFIRCMGIFVWPIIIENVPSLLGLPTLGSLNPFGRSQGIDNFEEIFGKTIGEFERELLERKSNVEGMLVDWYRGLVEEKFAKNWGFVKIHGYGDGEIGISFNNFGRTGRGAKIKDNKNLPSILTIISDIMEDMLEQRDPKPEYDRKKESAKRVNVRRDRSLNDRLVIDHYNEVSADNSRQESSNDDNIIAMFFDKIRSNETEDNSDANKMNNNLSVEDAYGAFELLFGTRLSERLAEKLNIFSKDNSSSHFPDENSEENDDNSDAKPSDDLRSGLILTLPRIDEEIIGRKITGGLMELGRKMKMQMTQLMPGISFVISFFIQIALAHARAAASVAGMMSNMALGSAMLTMVRQSLFGPTMNQPKIKYVYDNAAMGPGITWPRYDQH